MDQKEKKKEIDDLKKEQKELKKDLKTTKEEIMDVKKSHQLQMEVSRQIEQQRAQDFERFTEETEALEKEIELLNNQYQMQIEDLMGHNIRQ